MTAQIFVIIGDWNANLGKSGTNLFKPYMTDFCNENQLIISSKLLLPEDTYTQIQTREGSYYYSWIDHIVCSLDYHNAIDNISVHYDMSDDDHIPIELSIQVENLPKLSMNSNDVCGKINWEGISDQNEKIYYDTTRSYLSKIAIPVESLYCNNCNCDNDILRKEIEHFYKSLIVSLRSSSDNFCPK